MLMVLVSTSLSAPGDGDDESVRDSGIRFRSSRESNIVQRHIHKSSIRYNRLQLLPWRVLMPSSALVNNMNLAFNDKISGVLGLGFSRLSSIARTTPNATSFLGSLAANGTLEYPIFGLSITNFNNGSLTLGTFPECEARPPLKNL